MGVPWHIIPGPTFIYMDREVECLVSKNRNYAIQAAKYLSHLSVSLPVFFLLPPWITAAFFLLALFYTSSSFSFHSSFSMWPPDWQRCSAAAWVQDPCWELPADSHSLQKHHALQRRLRHIQSEGVNAGRDFIIGGGGLQSIHVTAIFFVTKRAFQKAHHAN